MLSRSVSSLVAPVIVFFMVGIPTFFVTRRYGRNWKRDWALILYPLAVLVPIFSFANGDRFSVAETIGSVTALILMGGIAGYFVFRGKKKNS